MSSIIESLKDEGVLKLYSDFRSGTYDDFSGNGHDATPVGTILKKESSGYALEMVNGTVGAQYTTIPQSADFNFGTTTDYSLYCWMKVRNDSTASVRIISNNDLSPAGCIGLDNTTGQIRIFHQGGAGGDYLLTADNAVVTTDSHHYCITCDRDVEGLAYIDGLNVAATETNAGARGDDIDSGEALQFGRVLAQTNVNFDGQIYVVLLANRVLTATEIAQIYGELESTKYPLKSLAKGTQIQKPELDDTSLIGAWGMNPQNNSLIDAVNSNDAAITGSADSTRTLVGDAMFFTGDNTATATDDSSMDVTGAMTVSVWVKPTDTAGSCAVVGRDGSASYKWLLYQAGGTSNFAFYVNTASGTVNSGNVTLQQDKWTLLTGVYDRTLGSNRVRIYEGDGSDTSAVNGYDEDITSQTGFDLEIGKYATNNFDGFIGNIELYNEAKSADWVAQRYEQGARAVQYKTDWGVNISSADITSGEIANTNFQVNTGTFQVATDTIDGQKVKAFKCTTNNSLMYLNVGAVDVSPTENMYGTWEFYLYKGGGGNAIHVSIKDEINLPGGGTANGYIFRMGAAERFRLRRETGGSVADLMTTDASFFNIDQWYKFKITRSAIGEFTVYVDDVLVTAASGSNPVTDANHTASQYLIVDMDNLDMLAIADTGGGHSLTKHLGVI